ncbi:MAG TPA: cation diffusion facilitator family transporter [Actinomycetota bacterium]|nr:cation diffusion facilitator family transporter [Actinomycetota bacterium]
MNVTGRFEMPPQKQAIFDKAVRLEWVTIVYLTSAVVFIYLTLGSSQAMKAAWLEDLLSLLPSISFLVAARFRDRPPSEEFPFGYHRSVSIAFLCASVALAAMGSFLLLDSGMKLVTMEHPSIGTIRLFGHTVWLGWPMIAALLWSGIPAFVIGRAKLPLARQLHDKVLHADAEMNKADWLTASAAIVGVVGIGFGVWWLDAVAALVISFEILRDGVRSVRAVVADLMDRRPRSVDETSAEPVSTRIENEMRKLPWVRDARARVRDEGHVFFAEVIVEPSDDRDLVRNIEDAQDHLESLDWRLHEVVIMPVSRIDEDELVRESPEEATTR